MAWFLIDSGIPACVVHAAEDVLSLAQSGVRVVIINSTSPVAEVADVVKTVRVGAPNCRIIVLHGGRHREDDPEIPADACIHDVSDPDALVETVRQALADDLPEGEPHEVAEEVADEVIDEAAGGV
jgi:DNA-binding NarL/FixJ family response regulator